MPLLIGMSGKYRQSADKVLADMAGFNYYLLKPCDPRIIIKLLDDARKLRTMQPSANPTQFGEAAKKDESGI